ncbi:MAG: nitroreductase family deazaflavin-dependent oxidoreductase [Proteobacteria bacterium]|nr:nitroreductase family deazaflavin-dependent oxidoreductase [Pseudomonadota bacterium]
MKAIKIITILFLVYVGIVILFESLLGYFQPANQSTLVITTTNRDGITNDRVLARLESDDQLYVSANHWPRAWYNQAIENPNVQIVFDGEKGDYLAVPVTNEAEHERVDGGNRHSIGFRILTGFAPRYFIRLEVRQPE